MYRINAFVVLLALFIMFTTGVSSRACASVEIIIARASNEPAGPGIIGEIAFNIQNRTTHTSTRALEYPAWFEPYLQSQTQGVAALSRLLGEYANKCPDTKLVLMGYSQGAHVVADVLCGSSEAGFPASTPLDESIANKITAVVLMGDPSHAADEFFNAGSSVNDGIFPRQNLDGCRAVKDKMVGFCDHKDVFCDSGDSLEVHMAYVIKYGVIAEDFVISMINEN